MEFPCASNRRHILFSIICCLVLTSCGGGGSSGGMSSSVSGGQYPLTITVIGSPSLSIRQVDLPGTMTIDAYVQGTIAASTIFVHITDSAGNFSAGQGSITKIGPTTYRMGLLTPNNLPIGNYSGNFQVELCSEFPCVDILGRTVVPYSLMILENPNVTAEASVSKLSLTAVANDAPVTWPVAISFETDRLDVNYAKFSDPDNVIQVNNGTNIAKILVLADYFFDATVSVADSVTPGVYSGNLDIVFCKDADCTMQFGGSAQVPYTVTVYSSTNLTPLKPIIGGHDWQTVQGDAGHTGFVAVTLDPSKFSPRWVWRSPEISTLTHLLDPVTANDKVFTVAVPDQTMGDESTAYVPVLTAIGEADGSAVWQQPLPDANSGPNVYGLGDMTAPAINGNVVYLARSANTTGDTGMFFGFNTADGNTEISSIFSGTPGEFGEYLSAGTSYTTNYLSPYGQSMLLGVRDGSYNKSFVSLSDASGTGSSIWDGCAAVTQSTSGSAAVNANNKVFISSTSGLILANTCELIASYTSAVDSSDGPTVVPGTSDVIAVGNGNIIDFDVAQKSIKWQLSGSGTSQSFHGSPAVTNGMVYVEYGLVLYALRESDGHLMWIWRPDWTDETEFLYNVIATENLVFLSTGRRTYAVDVATHQTVWTYPYPGRLAMSSNGILYIRRGRGPAFGSDGILAAINLH